MVQPLARDNVLLSDHGEDRRDELIAAATELFLEHGFEQTRIKDIAASAGVAKGLLYWYFPSKEALLADLSARILDRRLSQIEVAQTGLRDSLERLYVGVLVTTHTHYTNYRILRMIASVATHDDSPYHRSMRTHAKKTMALISRGQAEGVFRPDERPADVAYSIGSLVHELVCFGQLGLLEYSPAEIAYLAARSSLYMIAVDPGAVAGVLSRRKQIHKRVEAVLDNT